MTKETGGPAFPTDINTVQYGMTLRDYFAAKAMQGMLAAYQGKMEAHPELISEFSYFMADAMLKAREQ